MILYHGSDCIVNKPDILHSNKRFYERLKQLA